MRVHKTALNVLIVSALVCILALALTLFGHGMRFAFGAGTTMAYQALLLAMLAVVIFSFLFGWLRYDLAGGLALAIAAVHDQLLSLALCAIFSLAFGLTAHTPALLIGGLSFSYLFTIPVIREARSLLHANNNLTRVQAAEQAVKATRPAKFFVFLLGILVLVAFLVSGNAHMPGALLPLFTGLLAAALSSCFITPSFWAAFAVKSKRRK